MERLTGRNEKGDLLFNGQYVYAGDMYEAASALEGYEDTGWEPEKIKEAEKAMNAALAMACEIKAYRAIGTVEEFAAYKQAVDFSKTKAKELKERIDARSAANYHDESKRVLIFEERRMAYLDVVEAAEAALAAKEERE